MQFGIKTIITILIGALMLLLTVSAASAVVDVELEPDNPLDDDNLECAVYDSPGPVESFFYRWFKNDQAQYSLSGIGQNVVGDEHTSPGELWKCEVHFPTANPWVDPWPIGADYYDSVTVEDGQPVDEPAVWQTLNDQLNNVFEDDPQGTMVYQGLRLLCDDPDDPEQITVAPLGHNHYGLHMHGNNLLLTFLEQDYNDNGMQVVVYCNGVAASFDLRINPVNDAPTIDFPTTEDVVEDTPETLNLNNYAGDVDGDQLTFNVLSEDDTEVDCEVSGNTLYLDPAQDYNGPASCQIGVSDGYADDDAVLIINVVAENDDAEWQILDDQLNNVFEDDADGTVVYSGLLDECYDPDNAEVVTVAPLGHNHYDLEMNANDLVINNLEQDYNDNGMQVTVECNGVPANFNLRINPVNDMPTIQFIEPFDLLEDTPDTLDLSNYADDVDGDALYFSVTGENAAEVDCEISGNILTMVPEDNWNGQATCTIEVSDGNVPGTASDVLGINVFPVNDDAVWQTLDDQLNNVFEDDADGTVAYQGLRSLCDDPDDPEVVTVVSLGHNHYSLEMDGNDLVINDLEQDYNDNGMQVTVECNGVPASFNLRINPVNDLPVVETITGFDPVESEEVTFTATVSDADMPPDYITHVEFWVYYYGDWHYLGLDSNAPWQYTWNSLEDIPGIATGVLVRARARDSTEWGEFTTAGPFTVDNSDVGNVHDLALHNPQFPEEGFIAGDEVIFSSELINVGDYTEESAVIQFLVDLEVLCSYEVIDFEPGQILPVFDCEWIAEGGDHTLSIYAVPVEDEEILDDNHAEQAYENIPYGILDVESIQCLPVIVAGNEQTCSAYVTDQNDVPVVGAEVEMFYTSGEDFGSCMTNLTGGCGAIDIVELPGIYNVYATAALDGYVFDLDDEPSFQFEAIEERYDIQELMVYNDDDYSQEDYDFFRGEDMYVSFRIYDTVEDEYVLDDIVSFVTLVSNNAGGMINLTFDEVEGDEFRYMLEPIPTTHDFIGESHTFAIALNEFNEGGQSVVELLIRNNPPVIDPMIENFETNVGNTTVIELWQYENDVEDNLPGDQEDGLTWEVFGVDETLLDVELEGKTLTITALAEGQDLIGLRLYDLDNEFDDQNVFIEIGAAQVYDHDLALANVDVPVDAIEGQVVVFTSAVTNLGDYEESSVLRFFVDDVEQCFVAIQDLEPGQTTTDFTCAWTATQGQHEVRVVVDAVGGEVNLDNNEFISTIDVSEIQDVTAQIQYSCDGDEAPMTCLFIGIGTGTGTLSYHWTFGDRSSPSDYQNPYHIFDDDGTFIVTLLVTDQLGNTATDTVTISVNEDNNDHIARRRVQLNTVSLISEEILEAGQDLVFNVNFENIGMSTLEDFKAFVVVPELGLRTAKGPFEVSSGNRLTTTLVLGIPEDTMPGLYTARITLMNEDTKRVKHRDFRII